VTDNPTLNWYLVYCKPRQEAVARSNLDRQGYKTYLPLIREMRRRAGRRVEAVAPMFPRYLFIQLSTETDDWGPIRSTLGVASLVRFGQLPTTVPGVLIEQLRRREDADGLHKAPIGEYQRGARVRIADGGFAGYEGIFLARSGRDRITVLLKVLGRDTPAHIDPGAVEPA
jgi:transcriptional antiterminator RfaH